MSDKASFCYPAVYEFRVMDGYGPSQARSRGITILRKTQNGDTTVHLAGHGKTGGLKIFERPRYQKECIPVNLFS